MHAEKVEYLSNGFGQILSGYIFNLEKGLTRANRIEAIRNRGLPPQGSRWQKAAWSGKIIQIIAATRKPLKRKLIPRANPATEARFLGVGLQLGAFGVGVHLLFHEVIAQNVEIQGVALVQSNVRTQ